MKKLGKKMHQMVETIESYTCACSGLAKCDCSCSCTDAATSVSNYSSPHMSTNSDVYTAVYASRKA